MASTRLRSMPSRSESPSGEEDSLAPVAGAASLTELRQAMSSPGVILAEVDALLAALARPLAEGETPRERADSLLSLMELPEEAGDRTGSDGRTVRAAAVEALLELGYPYALEVPPEVLERVRRERPLQGRRARPLSDSPMPAVVITVLALMAQLFLLALVFFRVQGPQQGPLMLTLMGMVSLPPLFAFIGLGTRQRGFQSLGAWSMRLQGLCWLGFLFKEAASQSRFNEYLLLLPWYLPLLAGYLTSPKKPS